VALSYVPKPLPYPANALWPLLSERTLRTHYTEHYLKYVQQYNESLAKAGLSANDTDILSFARTAPEPDKSLALQVLNHELYWRSMAPPSHQRPASPRLHALLTATWPDQQQFEADFVKAGLSVLGSGYVWLWYNPATPMRLHLGTTNPVGHPGLSFGQPRAVPLIACDVWEHAYYLDVQGARKQYLHNFLTVLNWHEASLRLS
jgi:Fe-Mn family superoxide dismutase